MSWWWMSSTSGSTPTSGRTSLRFVSMMDVMMSWCHDVMMMDVLYGWLNTNLRKEFLKVFHYDDGDDDNHGWEHAGVVIFEVMWEVVFYLNCLLLKLMSSHTVFDFATPQSFWRMGPVYSPSYFKALNRFRKTKISSDMEVAQRFKLLVLCLQCLHWLLCFSCLHCFHRSHY